MEVGQKLSKQIEKLHIWTHSMVKNCESCKIQVCGLNNVTVYYIIVCKYFD